MCVPLASLFSEIFSLHDNPLSDHFLLFLSPSAPHWFLVCMHICVCMGTEEKSASGLVVRGHFCFSSFEMWNLAVARAFQLGRITQPASLAVQVPLESGLCVLGLSSGPHACTASSSLPEPPLQPSSLVCVPTFNPVLSVTPLHYCHLWTVCLCTVSDINRD